MLIVDQEILASMHFVFDKSWRREETGTTEVEMVGWHHQLNGHEFEQALGDSEGQGSLVCCSSWGCKKLDTTEWLNNNASLSNNTTTYQLWSTGVYGILWVGNQISFLQQPLWRVFLVVFPCRMEITGKDCSPHAKWELKFEARSEWPQHPWLLSVHWCALLQTFLFLIDGQTHGWSNGNIFCYKKRYKGRRIIQNTVWSISSNEHMVKFCHKLRNKTSNEAEVTFPSPPSTSQPYSSSFLLSSSPP